MSKECRYFVQHAWKKELCANCFESRQDHQRSAPCTKPLIAREVKNVQGILRGLRTTAVTGSRRKKNRVAFPEELTRVIGYGGDDYFDNDDELDPMSNDVQIIDADSKFIESKCQNTNDDEDTDSLQDSEEDRALSNLTRVNTNFNMITANLTSAPSETKPKTVGLMLGRIQKDADGNKTTLLISVTPFGADDVSVPTARRPIERKRADERPVALEKIVDMPLIASNNLMAIKKNDAPSSPASIRVPDFEIETKLSAIISESTVKSTCEARECENVKSTITKTECNPSKVNEESEKIVSNGESLVDPNYEDLDERTVEGESEPIENAECSGFLEDNNSREEAGVPDGKADEDEISLECGIPTEPRRSFLHSDTLAGKKPTAISKTISVEAKGIAVIPTLDDAIPPNVDSKQENGENVERYAESSIREDECGLDNQSSGNGKRRMAPKPPEANLDDTSGPLFTRKPNFKINLKSDCPVVREKEKRERATTSSSPKLKKSLGPMVSEDSMSFSAGSQPPEDSPEPRRSISLSHQDIPSSSMVADKIEEKKKSKSRFSLKKLLRMGGSRKDINLITTMASSATKVDEIPGTIQPKPRLEIIHPLELDGAAVEVLRHDKLTKCQEELVVNDSRLEAGSNVTARLGKPPPPPRNGQSSINLPSKQPSTRPPPPTPDNPTKSSPPVRAWHTTQHGTVAGDSIYANLGEVRSTLAPSKPQRTASIKRESETMKSNHSSPRELAASRRYEKSCLDVPTNSDSLDSTSSDSHDVYEFLSSSPECDSNLELRRHANEATRANANKRNSEGGGGGDHYRQFKYTKSTFARSNSLPYCHSETESDGFYTGNEGAEEDQDWKTKNEDFVMNRVRQRRNRTVVHRSLEDNYGAVVIANHESLAQLLERLSQVDHSSLSLHLRPLGASNPRLKDFHIEVDTLRTIGKRAFCSASWNDHPVTICLSSDSLTSPVSHKEFCLPPILEFADRISDEAPFNRVNTLTKNEDVTVSVLPPYQVCSMKSFLSNLPRQLRNNSSNETIMRECCLVLLQFVTALKNLQARGIEELPKSLGNFVLCKEERDPSHRLYHLQSLHVDHINDDEEQVSLCQSALVALRELNLTNRLPVIRELLVRERAVSLSQVKAVLEYSLWGPADVTLDVWKEREIVLQRWLDLERATILHALVRTRPPLVVADEYQLIFLVQTTAKNMCEASVLLDEQRSKFHSLQQT
ncbi:uncharacterized protein LOC107038709 isoform X2 [Diachasma alloeum]|uniref:uncharacterized protein LOC107038709 isoform X2 n=1 Tax=Diachasma alloeum TaxID=454923 RepID=UPI00073837A5|nr:uncharacterized protein LOC107038709 isoform X2 [Diachasma alloeum]